MDFVLEYMLTRADVDFGVAEAVDAIAATGIFMVPGPFFNDVVFVVFVLGRSRSSIVKSSEDREFMNSARRGSR